MNVMNNSMTTNLITQLKWTNTFASYCFSGIIKQMILLIIIGQFNHGFPFLAMERKQLAHMFCHKLGLCFAFSPPLISASPLAQSASCLLLYPRFSLPYPYECTFWYLALINSQREQGWEEKCGGLEMNFLDVNTHYIPC